MKPSFAETLENKLATWPAGKAAFGQLLPDASQPLVAQRRARLTRLQSVEGQLDYLCAFYSWMQQRPGFLLVTSTKQQKIQLLATAYNSGFTQSWSDLVRASQRHFFPYGARYPQEGQHAYSAVALAYYQQPSTCFWSPLHPFHFVV